MEDYDFELFALAPITAGLLVLGLASLLAPRLHLAWRLAGGGLITASLYGFLAMIFDGPHLASYGFVATAATLVSVAIIRVASGTAFARRLATPLGYGVALMVVATTGTVALYWRHEKNIDRSQNREMEIVGLIISTAEREVADEAHAVTDRGNAVAVSRARSPRINTSESREMDTLALASWGDATIKRQDSDDHSNCHGWVFTGGRYIVPGTAVEQILQDNGYAIVTTATPGDLAVYRGPKGDIVHTAIVRYVAPGRPPMVEGKWGRMGVYLHLADESGYGNAYAFYRSHRDGDVLKGINGSTGVRLTGAE